MRSAPRVTIAAHADSGAPAREQHITSRAGSRQMVAGCGSDDGPQSCLARDNTSVLAEGPTPTARSHVPHHHDQQAAARPPATDPVGATTAAEGGRP